jgi:regulator of ribosome biosynthesis
MPTSSGALDVRAMLAAASEKAPARPSSLVDREDDLTYDLGHLCAFDPTPVDEEAMAEDASAYLLRCARDQTQMLTNRLYALLQGAANKKVIELPPPTTKLPREKPLPEPKPLTRWEKFAASKGIVKKKRSKMVWDEHNQQWAPRYGYGRANNPKDAPENWVVEAKHGDDGSVDPFEERAKDRKEAKQKQKRQEERNRLEAGHAAFANKNHTNSRGDRKSYLNKAIGAVQVSTASAGRFDKKLKNEPSQTKGKRNQYETGIGSASADTDAQRAKSIVSKMFPEAGYKHDKLINKGVAAKHANLAREAANREAGATKSITKGRKGGGGGGKKGKKK